MKGFYRQVAAALKCHGWYFERMAKGDHELWAHPDVRHKVTVDGVVKSRHTANIIMKQAGIKQKF